MSKRTIALICATFVAIFYALNFTAVKEVVPAAVGPFGLAWYRVFFTCIIFWIIALFAGPKEKVTFKDLRLFALAAFCGVGLNMITFLWGLSLTSAISASVLMVTTPIIVLVLSALFLKEKLTFYKIFGISLGFAGAALLIFGNSKSNLVTASNPSLGNLLVFINAVSYAFYIILAKKLTAKFHVFTLMKWLYFFGVVFITPLGIKQGLAFDPINASWHDLLNIGYVIVFATFGTYMLNIIAIKTLKPSVVTVFIYLQPLIASIFAISLGKDILTTEKLIAGILIFVGVYCTTLKVKKAKLF